MTRKSDKLPEPVNVRLLPCCICGKPSTKLVKSIKYHYPLPVCDDVTHYSAFGSRSGDMEKLAHDLDMLAASGDIMACHELLARRRAEIFGEEKSPQDGNPEG
jgi:hypothetical protein